jgi:hypothetical protein
MIKCTFGDGTIRAATKMANAMGALNNSISKGDGNVAGFIGELIVASILDAKQDNTYQYDLVLPDGKTIDVKSKRTNRQPKPHYDCSVAAFNTTQECDYYAFVRMNVEARVAWFLGMIPKEDYYKQATLIEAGDIIGSNQYMVRSSCYNLAIEDIWRVSEHDNYIRRREHSNEAGRQAAS